MLCDMKSKGITVKGIPYMDGAHVYNEVYLDDVHMPAKYIIGQENEGWAVVNVLAGFEDPISIWLWVLSRLWKRLLSSVTLTREMADCYHKMH